MVGILKELDPAAKDGVYQEVGRIREVDLKLVGDTSKAKQAVKSSPGITTLVDFRNSLLEATYISLEIVGG